MKQEKSFSQVIKETLDIELKNDKTVFILGEDIRNGGAFGVTKGLHEKHGSKRIVDTPMSEAGITGLSIGAAMGGLKPVLEIMFMDFVTLVYDQLMNHAGIFNHISNNQVNVPMVMRVAAGAGRGYGATHSKTLIAPLLHIPGIKVVMPSDAATAHSLLKAAIKDPNPVVFIEHKLLYPRKQEIDLSQVEPMKIGQARIIQQGSDITVLCYGKMVELCQEVAEELEDISIEIVDLLSLKPLDMETIKNSVEKTKKVIIVDEGYSECGVSAEISAKIIEEMFYSLEAPIKRVNSADIPIPCKKQYEDDVVPNKKRIIQVIKELNDE